jgi:hypothetical protein
LTENEDMFEGNEDVQLINEDMFEEEQVEDIFEGIDFGETDLETESEY